MTEILRPRRSRKLTAQNRNIVLKKGEIFFEAPNTGVGTGVGKIKMGDGYNAYNDLPYFMEQPLITNISDESLLFNEAPESSNANLLNGISSKSKLNNIVGNIKRLLRKLNMSINTIDENFGGLSFGVENGIYGYYVNNEFHPFKHWHIDPETGKVNMELQDNYLSPVSGGCFTQIQYKPHAHVGQIRYGSTDDLVRRLVGPNAIISNTKTGCFQSSVQKITGTWTNPHDDDLTCSRCGAVHDDDPYYQEWIGTQHVCLQFYTLTCGKTAGVRYSTEGIEGYICSCGRHAGQSS